MPDIDGIARNHGNPGNIEHDSFARNYFAFFKKIEITEQSGSTLTDYQVAINTTIPDEVRFVDHQGNLLSHWKESSSKAWIKVNNLEANSTITIYMLYGNTTASNNSNGSNTFIVFDDFNDNTRTGWTVVKDNDIFTETNQRLEATETVNYKKDTIVYDTSFTTFNFIIEFDCETTKWATANNARYGGFSLWTDSTYYLSYCTMINKTNMIEIGEGDIGGYSTTRTAYNPSETTGTWNVKVTYDGSYVKHYVNGDLAADWNVTLQSTIKFGIMMSSGGAASTEAGFWIDNYRVRKYASTEPSVTISYVGSI